jgi:hypothetical protein
MLESDASASVDVDCRVIMRDEGRWPVRVSERFLGQPLAIAVSARMLEHFEVRHSSEQVVPRKRESSCWIVVTVLVVFASRCL